MNEIKSEKVNIAKVFEEWYTIPSYQRNYVWDSDNVLDLLNDIKDNYIEHENDEYFLGSFIKQSKDEVNDLLDGQQRITTLFLLFAFLRDYDKTPDDLRDDIQNFVYQKANKVKKISERVRLDYQIRGNVRDFVNDFVIKPQCIIDKFEDIRKKSLDKKENLSIQHMCNTLVCCKDFFEDNASIDIEKYIQFITSNVVMIYISANTLEDAFRLFSIMNDRGMKLNNADIIKSQNLEKIADDKTRDDYARQWEDIEEALGPEFDRFLTYVRNVILKTRIKTNLLDEYEKNIFLTQKINKGKDFFKIVQKYFEIYDKYIKLNDNHNIPYCNLMTILNESMQSTEFVPAIMLFCQKYQENQLLEFTKKLVCKNLADTINRVDLSSRTDSMYKIMIDIERSNSIDELMQSDNFNFDKNKFLANIEMDVYGQKSTKPLLMLLEYESQDNTLPKYSYGMISIEHILPQTPTAYSQWVKDFTEEERANYTHKIGNLCIIGRRKNSSLSNLDYNDKRKKYFEKNIGSFARTLKIYNKYSLHWNMQDLKENQINTIAEIRKIFGI